MNTFSCVLFIWTNQGWKCLNFFSPDPKPSWDFYSCFSDVLDGYAPCSSCNAQYTEGSVEWATHKSFAAYFDRHALFSTVYSVLHIWSSSFHEPPPSSSPMASLAPSLWCSWCSQRPEVYLVSGRCWQCAAGISAVNPELPVVGHCQDLCCRLLVSCPWLLPCFHISDCTGGVAHLAAAADSIADSYCNRFHHLVMTPVVSALAECCWAGAQDVRIRIRIIY